MGPSAQGKLPPSNSLAKVLGPRTAAKTSASSFAARAGPSANVAVLLGATVVPKVPPATSLAPKEKVKARMRMREKPLSAFSFGTAGASGTGRVTRSVSLKKKEGGRSGSVGAKNSADTGVSRE